MGSTFGEGSISMKLKSIVAFVAAAFALAWVAGGGVLAHAELDRSLPEAGSTVERAPKKVEIWFTQEIAEGSKIEVTGAAGAIVHEGEAELDLMDPERKHLTIGLKADLPSGIYTVTWTSKSAEDGDEESDSFQFTVQGSGTPVASPVASPEGSPAAAMVSGNLQATPEADPVEIDMRAWAIALGAGALAALLIYGFWRLVRPRRHPFDRTGK
jgi:methionine-rich copper-binding protein CopC